MRIPKTSICLVVEGAPSSVTLESPRDDMLWAGPGTHCFESRSDDCGATAPERAAPAQPLASAPWNRVYDFLYRYTSTCRVRGRKKAQMKREQAGAAFGFDLALLITADLLPSSRSTLECSQPFPQPCPEESCFRVKSETWTA